MLKALWTALADYYYEIIPFTGINLLWVACLIGVPALLGQFTQIIPPALAIVPIIASIICAPPAFGAVYYVGRRYADGENVNPRDFLFGFRHYFLEAWKLTFVDFLLGAVIFANLLFYAGQTSSVLRLIALPFLYLIVFWLLLQPYLFGLLIYQQDKRLRTLGRNAMLLVVANLPYSFVLLIVTVLLVGLSTILGLPFLAFLGVVGAMWHTSALDILLEKYPNTKRDRQATTENIAEPDPAEALSE